MPNTIVSATENLNKLTAFHQTLYRQFGSARDALFELGDAVQRVVGLAWVGQTPPPLADGWKIYFRRFAGDHWYRFASQPLPWTLPRQATVVSLNSSNRGVSE